MSTSGAFDPRPSRDDNDDDDSRGGRGRGRRIRRRRRRWGGRARKEEAVRSLFFRGGRERSLRRKEGGEIRQMLQVPRGPLLLEVLPGKVRRLHDADATPSSALVFGRPTHTHTSRAYCTGHSSSPSQNKTGGRLEGAAQTGVSVPRRSAQTTTVAVVVVPPREQRRGGRRAPPSSGVQQAEIH